MPESRLVLTDVNPQPRLGFDDAPDEIDLRLAPLLKGDPGVTGLRYVTVADAQGNPIATLLTGTIQEEPTP